MNRIFDFHFHLLFKHYIGVNEQGKDLELNGRLQTKGITRVINEVLGGPFDSQSSPAQLKDSRLYLGVTGILSLEHAFANRLLHLFGHDLSRILPVKHKLLEQTKAGALTYFDEFNRQVQLYLDQSKNLSKDYGIRFLNRNDWQGKDKRQIQEEIRNGEQRWLAFSIEGGHNLSNVPIRKGILSRNPEKQLQQIQERADIDFLSLNLCHLSHIPEQPLGGFAQGLNKLSQLAFSSEDFMPKTGLGLTELGKKVIRQALSHEAKPILIDVKHMSLYTRLDYYRYREALAGELPKTKRLPLITSHTGFTFSSLDDFLKNKRFKSVTGTEAGLPISKVTPENRKIGRTNDLINKGLYANPWSINLFDEEIIEIMQSKGMIGISLDQRVLGVSNPGLDSIRDKYFEPECIAYPEWEKLFRDGKMPGAEEGLAFKKSPLPGRPERHMMLLSLHLIHAVRIGYANLNWLEGTSPWDHLCVGSDFDGLINPINGIEDITQLDTLREELKKYLIQADKYLVFNPDIKALQYNEDGKVNAQFLDQVIEKFMFDNGLDLISRYLTNWEDEL